ncbi:MAG: methyltransferase domain-containing protein [Candidatus Diapherotrites archaeon]
MEGINPFRYLQNALSKITRKRRIDFFLSSMERQGNATVLDVGASANFRLKCGGQGRLIALNTSRHALSGLCETPALCVVGDGCALPFKDKSVDMAFSNAVIEHAGSWERQRLFADEIRRVGKGYIVCTPNRHFPYEPHFHLPLFQFMPAAVQRFLKGLMGKGHLEVRLLSRGEMKGLFPDAEVFGMTFDALPEVLIAHRK